MEEPEVTLVRWQVMEIEAGTRHFVGYNLRLREGRVSSPIQTFDPKRLTGMTRSGRIYKLIGEPDVDPDAECTWYGWMRVNGVKRFEDVTDRALGGC